jgi:hypothetical protein
LPARSANSRYHAANFRNSCGLEITGSTTDPRLCVAGDRSTEEWPAPVGLSLSAPCRPIGRAASYATQMSGTATFWNRCGDATAEAG